MKGLKVRENPHFIHILTFHGIGMPERDLPEGEDKYWLDQAFFEAILDWIQKREDFQITFDDSNSSDFDIALPALLKRQLKATFFVVSDRIDKPGFLSSREVRMLARSGMVIGSHGTKHRPWASLNPIELHEELKVSKEHIESLIDQTVCLAACPLGSYNRNVLRAARAASYSRVFTSDQGPGQLTDWVVARNTIMRSTSLSDVQKMVQNIPCGLQSLFRSFKLMVKRYR
jgi:peptidoglycan/xylan/chitin deacetylase (PgdA/CDA1 family)